MMTQSVVDELQKVSASLQNMNLRLVFIGFIEDRVISPSYTDEQPW